LHAVDYEAAGLAGLGRPDGYVERQVRGWMQRYTKSATHEVPDMATAAEWLAANLPPDTGASLIHNDFKLDNVVLAPALFEPGRIVRVLAVLDWEMATIGDPLMDLGTTLAYWIEAGDPPVLQRIGLGQLPGSLRRVEVAALYAEQRGLPAAGFYERIIYYYVFGLFKVAVIAQQIYYRFRQGFTRDSRFGGLDGVVAACAAMAAQAIKSRSL
jgi:aminoglycoside phosphotransferase (APT) family kinase protein